MWIRLVKQRESLSDRAVLLRKELLSLNLVQSYSNALPIEISLTIFSSSSTLNIPDQVISDRSSNLESQPGISAETSLARPEAPALQSSFPRAGDLSSAIDGVSLVDNSAYPRHHSFGLLLID